MIPSSIVVAKGYHLQVVIDDIDTYGKYDEKNETIYIKKSLPEEGKLLILIHEIIHVAESQLIEHGVLGKLYNKFFRRIWGEALVTHLAPLLFAYLGQSGMLTGVTPEDAEKFVEQNTEP